MPEEFSLGVMLFGFGLTYLTVHNRKVVGFPLNYSQLEVAATIRTFTAEGGLADIFVNDKTIVVCVVCLMRARIDACKVFRRYD